MKLDFYKCLRNKKRAGLSYKTNCCQGDFFATQNVLLHKLIMAAWRPEQIKSKIVDLMAKSVNLEKMECSNSRRRRKKKKLRSLL